MAIVIVYALFIFADLIMPRELVDDAHPSMPPASPPFLPGMTIPPSSPPPPGGRSFEELWEEIFRYVDLVFLSLFMVERGFALVAFGPVWFSKQPLEMFDAVVVLISFVMIFVFWDDVEDEDDSNSGAEAGSTLASLARLVRLVRIFRILTVMNKVQKSRASAHVLSKKAKYRKLGSPVERVLEILLRLKRDPLDGVEDRENLSFIIDMIVSDQLYTVSVNKDDISGDMASWLSNAGVSTSTRKPVEGKDAKGRRQAATLVNGGAGGVRRNSTPGEKTLWVDKLISSDEVSACLKSVGEWDFDYFDFEAKAGGTPVTAMVVHLIRLNGLEDTLGLNVSNLVRFVAKIEAGYKKPDEVPFHNMSHAADVVQGTAFFLAQPKIKEHITPLDVYALILAAAMHDHNHPGVNNAFLVNTRDDLAVLYNDASTLEMFHLASSWRLLLAKDCDVFDSLSPEQYAEVRQTIVHVILGTDMKYHFDHLTKFKTRAGAGAFDSPDRKDVRLLLAMCLHSADVSNPAKPWNLSVEWSARVMDEFFRQGDSEAGQGLPVSPFMDREKTNMAQCQIGFINILIKPFFEEWCSFLGHGCEKLVENIASNISKWETDGEEALGERGKKIKAGPDAEEEDESADSPTKTLDT